MINPLMEIKEMLGMITNKDPGTSGFRDIAETLGGGIKENSLVLIEGDARSGKSVLCQHIASAVLRNRATRVAFYSSEYGSEGLAASMGSLSLKVNEDLADDRLQVYKIYAKSTLRAPEVSLKLIVKHIQSLPREFKLVIIDSPSVYLTRVFPNTKMDFLQACKEVCVNERSVIVAVEFFSLEQRTLARAYAMSDYYLKLRSQDAILDDGKVDTRIIKVMEVAKLGGVEYHGGASTTFEIKPGLGIQVRPFVRVRI
jgi:archaellum biogenesis ATPase FlaH